MIGFPAQEFLFLDELFLLTEPRLALRQRIAQANFHGSVLDQLALIAFDGAPRRFRKCQNRRQPPAVLVDAANLLRNDCPIAHTLKMQSDALHQVDSGQTPTIYLVPKVSNFDHSLQDSGWHVDLFVSPHRAILWRPPASKAGTMRTPNLKRDGIRGPCCPRSLQPASWCAWRCSPVD